MVAMTKWFVLLNDGNVCGPFSECQIRNGIHSRKINDEMRVRQGESGWIRVEKVRKLFEGLDQAGIYLRDGENREYGPFTQSRYQAMQAADELPTTHWLRRGRNGKWEMLDAPMKETLQPIHVSAAPSSRPIESESQNLSSTLPAIPPAPVMKLRTWSWLNAVTGVCSRFENLVLGDPLTGH